MSGRGVTLIAAYVIIACAPAALAAWLGPPGGTVLEQAGRSTGLTGFAILVLQGVLAARWKWATRHFGLDIVLRFHRCMALFAGLLLVAHPILLSAGGSSLLAGDGLPWFVWAGLGVLVLLLATLAVSAFRKELGVSFERWRLLHGVLAVVILGGAFVHSWLAGADLAGPVFKGLWIALLGGTAVVLVWHRFVGPALRRRCPYRVTEVKQEAENVWTVEMEPPDEGRAEKHLPGQFHFLTLHRDRGLPEEEHHFTISSSPEQAGRVASTIKAVGDFTSTIGDTRPGDTASVQGPFGRFSYRLHPEERDLVFVAGGIGITPLASMLRAMRDAHEDYQVLLLYGNRTRSDIVFREELDEMAAGEHPRLTVVHVLSRESEDWQGERGHIDREALERHVGRDVSGKTFYVCGPKPLLAATVANLKAMGVKDGRIRTEIFSLVG
jgi:predicted ferric reductase